MPDEGAFQPIHYDNSLSRVCPQAHQGQFYPLDKFNGTWVINLHTIKFDSGNAGVKKKIEEIEMLNE